MTYFDATADDFALRMQHIRETNALRYALEDWRMLLEARHNLAGTAQYWRTFAAHLDVTSSFIHSFNR